MDESLVSVCHSHRVCTNTQEYILECKSCVCVCVCGHACVRVCDQQYCPLFCKYCQSRETCFHKNNLQFFSKPWEQKGTLLLQDYEEPDSVQVRHFHPGPLPPTPGSRASPSGPSLPSRTPSINSRSEPPAPAVPSRPPQQKPNSSVPIGRRPIPRPPSSEEEVRNRDYLLNVI